MCQISGNQIIESLCWLKISLDISSKKFSHHTISSFLLSTKNKHWNTSYPKKEKDMSNMATKNPARKIGWVLNLISDCATRSCRLPKGHCRDNTICWEDTNSPWSLLWEWHYLCGNVLHCAYHICIRYYWSVAISAQTKLIQEAQVLAMSCTIYLLWQARSRCNFDSDVLSIDTMFIKSKCMGFDLWIPKLYILSWTSNIYLIPKKTKSSWS